MFVVLSLALLLVAYALNSALVITDQYVRTLANMEARRLAAFPYTKTPPLTNKRLVVLYDASFLDFNTRELGLVAK